jgi:hypothetical protein
VWVCLVVGGGGGVCMHGLTACQHVLLEGLDVFQLLPLVPLHQVNTLTHV